MRELLLLLVLFYAKFFLFNDEFIVYITFSMLFFIIYSLTRNTKIFDNIRTAQKRKMKFASFLEHKKESLSASDKNALQDLSTSFAY